MTLYDLYDNKPIWNRCIDWFEYFETINGETVLILMDKHVLINTILREKHLIERLLL